MTPHFAVSQPPLVEDDDLARSRNIKPGFFENEDLAELGPGGMMLFAGLWTLADREGRLEDRPKRIKAQVFPYFDFDVDTYLDALAERGFIVRYEVDGRRYIQIVNFAKHQNPHPRESPSTIPAVERHAKGEPKASLGTVEPGGFLTTDSLPLIPDSPTQSNAPAAPVVEPPPVRAKPRKRIPDDWALTDELREYAVDHGIPAYQVDELAAEFKRYWQGDGRPKADWDLTFMTRVRDQAGRYAPRASPASNGHRESAAAVFARMAMEDG